MTRRWPYFAAALTLLAGCAGSSDPGRTPGPTTQAPRSAAPSPAAATIGQWASFIAAAETPVLKADQGMAGCSMAAAPAECGLTGLTFAFSADTLSIKLAQEQDKLGTPPPEIASLIEQTVEALNAMKIASNNQQKCLVSTTPDCLNTDAQWDQAHDDVLAALNGWKPYTN